VLVYTNPPETLPLTALAGVYPAVVFYTLAMGTQPLKISSGHGYTDRSRGLRHTRAAGALALKNST